MSDLVVWNGALAREFGLSLTGDRSEQTAPIWEVVQDAPSARTIKRRLRARGRRVNKPIKAPIEVTCVICETTKARPAETVRWRRSMGQPDVCSSKCAWTWRLKQAGRQA